MIQLDVCSAESVAAALETVKSKHGELYGVVNNAGGIFEVARSTVDLNTYGVVRVTEAFIPIVKSTGGEEEQSTINFQNHKFINFQEELCKFHLLLDQTGSQNAAVKFKTCLSTKMLLFLKLMKEF